MSFFGRCPQPPPRTEKSGSRPSYQSQKAQNESDFGHEEFNCAPRRRNRGHNGPSDTTNTPDPSNNHYTPFGGDRDNANGFTNGKDNRHQKGRKRGNKSNNSSAGADDDDPFTK